jgi:hypothetical protein
VCLLTAASPAGRAGGAAAFAAPAVARREHTGQSGRAGGRLRCLVLAVAVQGRPQVPRVGTVGAYPPVLGQAADQLHQFLDGPAGGGGPYGLLAAVRFQGGAVQQFHQPGHVLHRAALRRCPDRLVRAVRVARGPRQQADQPGDVLHGTVHADRAERVDRGLRVLGGPLQHRDEVDDLLQRPVGHGGAHQVADGVAVLAHRPVVGGGVLVEGLWGQAIVVGEEVFRERVLGEGLLEGIDGFLARGVPGKGLRDGLVRSEVGLPVGRFLGSGRAGGRGVRGRCRVGSHARRTHRVRAGGRGRLPGGQVHGGYGVLGRTG